MSEQSALLESLERHFRRYLSIDPRLPLVLSLWVVATHTFESFDAFPYLAITSPTKRCGKTRLAELLELVCANVLRTVGISPAALFRTVEKKKPTLVIDEAEALRSRDERANALREILNAGYRKGQRVVRCEGVGKGFKTREFETFCPKVLVLIGSLPDTLADRCLAIEMTRRRGEHIERFRFRRAAAEAQPIQAQIGTWISKNRGAVEQWYQENDLNFLMDREAELWLPLFAVCAIIDSRRIRDLEIAAREVVGAKADDEPDDWGVKALADVREFFSREKHDRIQSISLVAALKAMEESPWGGWSDGRGLNERSLSRLLKPFGIHSKNLRLTETQVAKGYERADFEDAWSRYLDPVSATSATNVSLQQDRPESISATEAACSGSENAEVLVYEARSGVADKKQGRGVIELDLRPFAEE